MTPPRKDPPKKVGYRISLGKIRKKECRFCRQMKLEQNYREHIKTAHPGQDSSDLSGWGDQNIGDMFSKSSARKISLKSTVSQEEETVQNAEENNNFENLNIDALDPANKDEDDNNVCEYSLPTEEEDKNQKMNVQSDIGVAISSKLDSVLLKLDELDIKSSFISTEPDDINKNSDKANKEPDSVTVKKQADVDHIFQTCKSTKDIEYKFSEFQYDKEKGGFVCLVCSSSGSDVFQYEPNLEQDFSNSVQSDKFRFLKRNLKRHLLRQCHIEALTEIDAKHDVLLKEDNRNKAVGMRIGRICYYLFKKGRPDSDFPTLLYLHSSNDSDIGDINHSPEFPSQFLPAVAGVIQSKVRDFLKLKLQQTGFRPACKILADKATHKHRSRQLMGLVCAVPDSPQLLVAFFISIPVVKQHTGKGVAENIWRETDEYIEPEQYKGISVDGQYFSLHVPELMDEHYKAVGHHDWDPMHKAGLRDLKARKESKWLNDMTDLISRSFKLVNWGKMFEEFFDNVEKLSSNEFDISLKLPRFYSTTKFPNHVSKVNSSFRTDYPALIKTFIETEHNLKAGTAKDYERSKEISAIIQKIFNVSFVVHLSGSVDVYSVFSNGVNILQTVNMLPMTRYDLFHSKCLAKFRDMIETIELESCRCPSSDPEVCLWPVLHKDLRELEDKSSYRSVPLTTLMGNELRTRAGTVKAKDNLLLNKSQVIEKALKDLRTFVSTLYNMMEDGDEGVFDSDDLEMIEHLRILLDMESLAMKLKLRGASQIAALESKKFIETAKIVAVELQEFEDEELRIQYRTFLRRLEAVVDDVDEEELDSMKIIQHFLASRNNLYLDIELILHAISTAAVTKSVESVIESWVSVSESRSHNKRSISEDRLLNELIVAINGPLVQHADDIIKTALQRYWEKSKSSNDRSGHFVRRSENISDFTVSKVVDKLVAEPPRLPFMCPNSKSVVKIRFYGN